jgi:hypothetical protein
MSNFVENEAREDFNRVRMQEVFSSIFHILSPEKQRLLSLDEVKEVVRPQGETYRGMQTVPIDKIVGSEGRYRDFNKGFLPKHERLRGRWTSIDRAHLQDVILPAIRLYEIGGVYFVRDGNHRVSVAKAQGVMAIDAEVTSLDSEVELSENLTRDTLRRAVIDHEREVFHTRTGFDKIVPDHKLQFTATGRYDEVICHIKGHKYYLSIDLNQDVSFEEAAYSWYENVFRPIVDIIENERLISRFPGRTSADLYMWIVKHWDELKRRYGEQFSMKDAAIDFSSRYGKSFWARLLERLRRIFAKS